MSSEKESDRRPIAARKLPIFHKAAAFLAAKGISPNRVSIWSIYAGAVAGICFAATAAFPEVGRLFWVLGVCGVQLRLVANLLDGMVAVEHGKSSPVGGLYNEVPDRVSDTAIFVGLGYALASSPFLGLSASLAAMFTAYVRALGKGVAGYQEFCGPCAKQQRMFLVTMCGLIMGLAPDRLRVFELSHTIVGLPWVVLFVITIGSIVTALRRLQKISVRLRQG